MFIPKGFILLREAIVRLAETRAPEVGVKQYMHPPPRQRPEGLSGVAAQSWTINPPPDPWQALQQRIQSSARLMHGTSAAELAQDALINAMDELRQALFAGQLAAVAKLPSGAMTRIDAFWWGSDDAEQALASGDTAHFHLRAQHWPVAATVLSPEDEFARWLDHAGAVAGAAEQQPVETVVRQANAVVPYRTGTSGRPSSIHLVHPEHERRLASGEAKPKVTDEARCLEEWMSRQHPNAAPLGARRIENAIRDRHRTCTTCRASRRATSTGTCCRC